MCNRDYNRFMGGVDKSDQLLHYYETLHKCCKYWKKIFLHLIDVAVLNSSIIFSELRQNHPGDPELRRNRDYSQKSFREELACELAGIPWKTMSDVPVYEGPIPGRGPVPVANPRHTTHLAECAVRRGYCVVCKVLRPAPRLTSVYKCRGCQVYLCLRPDRNCFATYHSPGFDQYLPGQ